DEDGYWTVVAAKTPPLFAAALEMGALLGGGSPAAVAALGRLGEVMGVFVQVSDDVADALGTPASADWSRGRVNLAILYALTAEHPEREAFLALAARAGEPAALAEAQEILARCGAVGYCAYRLEALAREADALLAAAPLVEPAPITRLVAAQREPLRGLLGAISEDPHVVLGPAA
ncbi:MAG TPA: polyprenyl synthetase family protein, partial [Thermoanaerobaculia bacterium]|nr:polyprenyl synthetase family protein [Thermoanaerobaculia bacterium]